MKFLAKPLEKIKVSPELKVLEQKNEKHQIIVYNDDVNTFDWVIQCLIEICMHSPQQAEQCAIIIHYKGKCDVLTGSYEDLEPKCSSLLDKGINAEIL